MFDLLENHKQFAMHKSHHRQHKLYCRACRIIPVFLKLDCTVPIIPTSLFMVRIQNGHNLPLCTTKLRYTYKPHTTTNVTNATPTIAPSERRLLDESDPAGWANISDSTEYPDLLMGDQEQGKVEFGLNSYHELEESSKLKYTTPDR